ncbi:hypothetical protein HYT18_04075 [Candidatus Microgenomates bacterium]|nr:hypothetical protein [Candidatus Microgenomates bacterium]
MVAQKKPFKVGSLLKREDRNLAAILLAKGEIGGIFNRGVCALWFDGGNLKAVRKIWKIKGEGRKGRPVALTIGSEEFVPMIDENALSEKVRNLLYAPDFKQRVGSLCFIRAPLKASYQNLLPDHAKSFEAEGICMIQNWDPHGHDPTEQFLDEARRLGVKHPAVTSMNITGEREIVDQNEGKNFCQDHHIPIFLNDPQAHPKHLGSYTIFTFGAHGIRLERDGNIPGKFFENIFGMPVDMEVTKKPNYPQLEFPPPLFENLTGSKLREAILLYLKGQADV